MIVNRNSNIPDLVGEEELNRRKRLTALFFIIVTIVLCWLVFGQYKKGNKLTGTIILPFALIGIATTFGGTFNFSDSRSHIQKFIEPDKSKHFKRISDQYSNDPKTKVRTM